MGNKTTSHTSQARITVGLPNLQDQIRMVNRITGTATEPELEHWEDIGQLLSELYTQLNRQKQVTVYRLGNRSKSKTRADDQTDQE
jgi:hypothetical protein